MVTTRRDENLPTLSLVIRVVQVLLAITILGLTAYGVTFIAFDGESLSLFTAIVTIIITVYILAAGIFIHTLYNIYVVLGLDIFGIIFWLISFALLASETAQFTRLNGVVCDFNNAGFCVKRREMEKLEKRGFTTYPIYRNTMRAAVIFGAFEFVLFIVTFIISAVHVYEGVKSRRTTNSNMPAISNQDNVELQSRHTESEPIPHLPLPQV